MVVTSLKCLVLVDTKAAACNRRHTAISTIQSVIKPHPLQVLWKKFCPCVTSFELSTASTFNTDQETVTLVIIEDSQYWQVFFLSLDRINFTKMNELFAIDTNDSRIISLYKLMVAYYAYTYKEFILSRGKTVKNLLILAEV